MVRDLSRHGSSGVYTVLYDGDGVLVRLLGDEAEFVAALARRCPPLRLDEGVVPAQHGHASSKARPD
jgi:hypothetical protein